jgi:superfamily II DNA or RNA helicase
MLTSKGYAIRLDSLSPAKLESLKQTLTVTPETNADYAVAESYKVYQTSKNFIMIPRNFGIHDHTVLRDGAPVAEGLEFSGQLKTETCQIEAVEAVVAGLRSKGSGILSLPTGYGKTTVALYVLSKIAQKTLIVVHKEFLMTQWIERIHQFLPGARVGKIQGTVIDVENKDIVIGMLQSLSKKEYDKNTFSDFGLTIIDETHHVCTRSFSRLFSHVNTRYLLGLSATLERKDGLTYVLHWFLGPTLFKVERKSQTQVRVDKSDFNHELFTTNPFPLNRARKPNLPDAITKITKLPERNAHIMSLIAKAHAENRKILVLTDRRQHCFDLLEACSSYSAGLYIGGMKPEELKESEQADVIFATYSLAHEGLDIPTLDTLIMASPKSDIVQSVGRILRETIGKSNTPLVLDIVDMWGPFKYQFFKRCKYYKSAGFSIKEEKLEEEPLTFLEDFLEEGALKIV